MMSMLELSKDTMVKLGTVVAVILFLAVVLAREVENRTNQARDLADLTHQIEILTAKIEQLERQVWTRADMTVWVLETEKANPDWNGPKLQKREQ